MTAYQYILASYRPTYDRENLVSLIVREDVFSYNRGRKLLHWDKPAISSGLSGFLVLAVDDMEKVVKCIEEAEQEETC